MRIEWLAVAGVMHSRDSMNGLNLLTALDISESNVATTTSDTEGREFGASEGRHFGPEMIIRMFERCMT